jgi:hypothetical protein
MVSAGMSPDGIDRMDISDVIGWYQVLVAYQKATKVDAPKTPRR